MIFKVADAAFTVSAVIFWTVALGEFLAGRNTFEPLVLGLLCWILSEQMATRWRT